MGKALEIKDQEVKLASKLMIDPVHPKAYSDHIK